MFVNKVVRALACVLLFFAAPAMAEIELATPAAFDLISTPAVTTVTGDYDNPATSGPDPVPIEGAIADVTAVELIDTGQAAEVPLGDTDPLVYTVGRQPTALPADHDLIPITNDLALDRFTDDQLTAALGDFRGTLKPQTAHYEVPS